MLASGVKALDAIRHATSLQSSKCIVIVKNPLLPTVTGTGIDYCEEDSILDVANVGGYASSTDVLRRLLLMIRKKCIIVVGPDEFLSSNMWKYLTTYYRVDYSSAECQEIAFLSIRYGSRDSTKVTEWYNRTDTSFDELHNKAKPTDTRRVNHNDELKSVVRDIIQAHTKG